MKTTGIGLGIAALLGTLAGTLLEPRQRGSESKVQQKDNPPGWGRRSEKRISRKLYDGKYIDRHGQHWCNGQPARKAERKGIPGVPRGYGDNVRAISFSR